MFKCIFCIMLFACAIAIVISAGCQKQQKDGVGGKVLRVGSIIKLKPAEEEKYIILHKHVFPEVLTRLKESNYRNYSIYLRDGILFAYFEYTGADLAADNAKLAADTTTQEWWKVVVPMQEPLESRKEGEWWATAEQMFSMDFLEKPSVHARRHTFVIEAKHEFEENVKKQVIDILASALPALKEAHFQNVSAFSKDGRIYIYFEYAGENYGADLENFAANPKLRSWWDSIISMMQKGEGGGIHGWWMPMREVFYLD